MFSDRVPAPAAPNAWTSRLEALRATGAPLADLTETNPTRLGLAPLAGAAAAIASVAGAPYAPEPAGLASAREAVAAMLAVDRGVQVSPEHIVLTPSTSEAYAHVFRLLADPGQRVLAPAPSYPLFAPLARAEGVTLEHYPLCWDGAWHVDRAALAAIAPGARAVIVVEPNNPTGSCLDPDDHAFVAALAARHGLAIVADEVFGDFPRDRRGPLPTWLGEREALTFVLGGLSKRCGLPQHKLAWIAVGGPGATRREALAGLEWLGDLFLGVATPVQHALPALLALRQGFGDAVQARVRGNLASFARLVAARPEASVLAADGGWSAVLRVPATREDDAWALALLGRGTVVHPGHFYDFDAGSHLVVSLVAEPAAVAAGCDAIAAELAGA